MAYRENNFVEKTIFALSTPLGKSGIAVIRISGAHAKEAVRNLGYTKRFVARYATLVELFTFSNPKKHIDSAIIIYFEAPNSFTGEDVIELQVHGSIAVIKELLDELGQMDFLRPAEAGEFTKQAFINGKLDMIRVEALSELIHAETKVQKNIALRQFSGQLENLYEKWRLLLIDIISSLEPFIDFPDEYIPEDEVQKSITKLFDLKHSIKKHVERSRNVELIRHGINIAIVGPPNAGKSTLINLLTHNDISIVSDTPGTTRDVVHAQREINGIKVNFSDTAGLRKTTDIIENDGIHRTKLVSQKAEIIILIFDINDICVDKIHDTILTAKNNTHAHNIIILNKSDLLDTISLKKNTYRIIEILKQINYSIDTNHIIVTSIKEIGSFDKIMIKLREIIAHYGISENEDLITSLRQIISLKNAIKYMDEFTMETSLDLSIQNLRYAAYELEYVSGKNITIEEITDQLFRKFCIGK